MTMRIPRDQDAFERACEACAEAFHDQKNVWRILDESEREQFRRMFRAGLDEYHAEYDERDGAARGANR